MFIYLFHFIISFIATVLFSIIFNAPKKLLLACGFVGAVAWTIYQMTVGMDLGKSWRFIFRKSNIRINESYNE